MKKCPVCGHIMEDEAQFCSACGGKLPPRPGTIKHGDEEEKLLAAEEKSDENSDCSGRPKLKRRLIIAGVVIALLLLPSAIRALDLSLTMLTLKSKITNYCAERYPELPIREIKINATERQDKKWTKVDVTLTMDCPLSDSKYDKIYDSLFAHVFDSPLDTQRVQITPLEIIDDSGNDYGSGYFDRWLEREMAKRASATPSPTPSSISNPGYGFTTEDAKWAVYNMAKEQIPDYLSCPSTMKICSYEDATIQDAGYNIWKGEGYFDAENLYGATVRGKWNITCKIENGKCRLAKLKIDDIVVYNDGTQ